MVFLHAKIKSGPLHYERRRTHKLPPIVPVLPTIPTYKPFATK